jgi:hypothetical protein
MAAHPKFNWRKFGYDLHDIRIEVGGLRKVAKSVGIHHATWCRAEQGKPVTVPVFLTICDWMVCDPFKYMPRR